MTAPVATRPPRRPASRSARSASAGGTAHLARPRPVRSLPPELLCVDLADPGTDPLADRAVEPVFDRAESETRLDFAPAPCEPSARLLLTCSAIVAGVVSAAVITGAAMVHMTVLIH
ncbi:hypothetical protein [Gryllotalpicola ginsengisoli]|uniref:hypothetical protein n=1 Tax=Gryllotalpicola ginsengisoli TaxID=444608 RepID=UPI0012DC91A6|nr:hypothetical protein [Gryllotalpicola ginsengisoli]